MAGTTGFERTDFHIVFRMKRTADMQCIYLNFTLRMNGSADVHLISFQCRIRTYFTGAADFESFKGYRAFNCAAAADLDQVIFSLSDFSGTADFSIRLHKNFLLL